MSKKTTEPKVTKKLQIKKSTVKDLDPKSSNQVRGGGGTHQKSCVVQTGPISGTC